MARNKLAEQQAHRKKKEALLKQAKTAESAAEPKKQRKKYRRKRVKSQIRKLQKHGELLVSKAGFKREVIKILDKVNPELLITSNAVKALQASAESALTNLFIDANTIATQCGKRVSPLAVDLQAAVALGNKHFISKF